MYPFTLGRNDLCVYGSLFAASALAAIPVSCSAFQSRIALWQTGIGTDHPGKIDLSAPRPLRRPSFYAARRLYLKMGRRTLTTVALDWGKRMPLETRPLNESFACKVVGRCLWDRWSEMGGFKGTSFDDRLSAAANAKKTELEKFRTRYGTNDPAFAERQAVRHAVSVARDARTAERNASRLAGIAREAVEKAARDAAVEAEQAARDAEVVRQAANDVALQAERKAARDARYAARKARPRKR
jgi:hypothetical protein